jgi:DUF4097 and DUF4098 domain-containing protein YvlB
MKTKRLFSNSIIFCILIAQNACDESVITTNNNGNVNNTNFSACDSFRIEIPFENQSLLDMHTINGTITIYTTENTETIKLRGIRSVKSESIEDARHHLDLLQVNIQKGTEKVYVTTQQPDQSYGRTYTIDYIVEIPSKWNIHIDQINGNIDIDTVSGNMDVYLVNGNVILNKVYGCLRVDLINGVIKAAVSIPPAGFCILKNINGQILLSIPDTTSAHLRVSAVNGTVGVHNLLIHDLQSSPKEILGILGSGDGDINCTIINGEILIRGTDD